MNRINARRLIEQLPDATSVVDVGGGAMPFPRADYVIDAVPFEARSALGDLKIDYSPRFTKDTWCRLDLCEHKPWPFPDKFFDFATCSHLLEDVRDPIWICSELCRVAKAGYIEVPSRILEQTRGIEHPSYAGYYHHRWLVSRKDQVLEFRHKPHLLHSVRDAIIADIGPAHKLNDDHAILVFEWTNSFEFREVLEFDESAVVAELCQFANAARAIPNLLVPSGRSLSARLKRHWYLRRLRSGRR